MSEKKIAKLFKASDLAASVQHGTWVVAPDGRLRINGTKSLVRGIIDDKNISKMFEDTLKTFNDGNG